MRTAFLKVKIKHFLCLISVFLIVVVSGLFTHLLEYDYHTDFKYPYDGDIQQSLLQLQQNQVPDIAPINVYNYEYVIKSKNKCIVEDQTLRLVYIIKSAPENLDRRNAIRKTWGYQKRFSDVEIRTVFILGVKLGMQDKINEESLQYHDIVQANFTDSYFNNTIKTMMGFKWAITHCTNAKFYMFVDDDYYISTKNVLRFVRNPGHYPEYVKNYKFNKDKLMEFELPDDVRLYAGYVFFSAPHRHYFSKWFVTLNEYPFHMWPPYVTAGAYVLSHQALVDLYYGSFYTQHFRFDDIYIGLVAKKVQIEPFHCEHFHFYKKTYDYNFTIASHGYSPTELVRTWTQQKSSGNA